MKTVSFNGKWKGKVEVKNLGIENNWYIPKNYKISDKNLIDIEIPRSINLLQGFENFEGVFQIKSLINLAREIDNSRIVTVVSRKLIPDLTRGY